MRSLLFVLALEGQTFCELGNGEGSEQLTIQNINSLQKYEAVWVTGGFPGFLSVGRGSPCCPITGAHSSSIPAC